MSLKATTSTQLDMFEPKGSALSLGASIYALRARNLDRNATNLELGGFTASASRYRADAQIALDRSFTFEMALQFEVLAELV